MFSSTACYKYLQELSLTNLMHIGYLKGLSVHIVCFNGMF